MGSERVISFGDHVRVRVTPCTTENGLAGLVGQVYGETTPSMTGVEVIGEVTSDYAVNVHFDGRGAALWFAPDLLEFLDHAPGTEVTLAGVPKRWIRSADGAWTEENNEEKRTAKKPWWKVW